MHFCEQIWGAAHLDNGPKLGQIAPDSLDALKPRWANGVKSNNSVGLISAQGAQFNILLRMTMLTCAVRLNKNDSSVLAVFPGEFLAVICLNCRLGKRKKRKAGAAFAARCKRRVYSRLIFDQLPEIWRQILYIKTEFWFSYSFWDSPLFLLCR